MTRRVKTSLITLERVLCWESHVLRESLESQIVSSSRGWLEQTCHELTRLFTLCPESIVVDSCQWLGERERWERERWRSFFLEFKVSCHISRIHIVRSLFFIFLGLFSYFQFSFPISGSLCGIWDFQSHVSCSRHNFKVPFLVKRFLLTVLSHLSVSLFSYI